LTANKTASENKSAAAKGKQNVYSKAVITKLAVTKPQLWTNLAEARVMFVISPKGEPTMIKLLTSSNDKAFDDVVLEWIKRARFAPPPPDATAEDLVIVVNYKIQ
jgi:TonB family protein